MGLNVFLHIWGKEWVKLRLLLLTLLLLTGLFFIYFYASVAENFSNIEPETMRWYQALHIGVPFFEEARFLPLMAGLLVAFWQFSQELRDKRLRIILHFPVPHNTMLASMLGSGLFILLAVFLPYLLLLPLTLGQFYPQEGWMLGLENGLVWVLGGLAAYIAAASVILEPFWGRRIVLGAILSGWVVFYFITPTPGAYRDLLLWLFLMLPLPLLIVMDSVYRFRNGNVDPLCEPGWITKAGWGVGWLFGILVLAVALPLFVGALSGNVQGKSYIFYSVISENFVYQDAHGGHDFTYGDSDGRIFDQAEFERRLPFVYWKNLDIQGQLPIAINGKIFGKSEIRARRQSFRLTPSLMPDNSRQPGLYPLFNPAKKVGTIPFPETMFRIDFNGIHFIDWDGVIEDEESGVKFTQALQHAGFDFPSKRIAGKTTNLKPFDEGYFIQDSSENLWHLKQIDGIPHITQVQLPENIRIKHLLISENRKKAFYGLLLDEKDRLYLISYDQYRLIPLPAPGYDPLTMELQLFSNPVGSILRYGDSGKMRAIALDHQFQQIAAYERDIPETHTHLYKQVLHWLTPFSLKLDKEEKSAFVRLDYETHDFRFLVGSMLLLVIFMGVNVAKKRPIQSTIPEMIGILLLGLYGFALALMLPRNPT